MEVNDANSEEHDSEERDIIVGANESLDVDQAPSPADEAVEWTISKRKIQNQRYLDGKSRKAYQLSVRLSGSFEGTDGRSQELDPLL